MAELEDVKRWFGYVRAMATNPPIQAVSPAELRKLVTSPAFLAWFGEVSSLKELQFYALNEFPFTQDALNAILVEADLFQKV